MDFQTKYKRRPSVLEKNGGEIITEQAGYIPPKAQIEQMIIAGKRLDEYRKEMYDLGPEDEDDESPMDPTRRPGYDMADASQDAMMVSQRLEEAARAAKENEVEKSNDKSSEAVQESDKTESVE